MVLRQIYKKATLHSILLINQYPMGKTQLAGAMYQKQSCVIKKSYCVFHASDVCGTVLAKDDGVGEDLVIGECLDGDSVSSRGDFQLGFGGAHLCRQLSWDTWWTQQTLRINSIFPKLYVLDICHILLHIKQHLLMTFKIYDAL